MIYTQQQLSILWKEYWSKENAQLRKDLRFGQFVFNEIGYEFKGSFYTENAFDAYSLLQSGLCQ